MMDSILPSLLRMDSCVALIGVIACEAAGRLYLSKREAVIDGLIRHLGKGDNTELQSLVALQRLSLSRSMQTAMIKYHLMTWIIKEFKQFILKQGVVESESDALLVHFQRMQARCRAESGGTTISEGSTVMQLEADIVSPEVETGKIKISCEDLLN